MTKKNFNALALALAARRPEVEADEHHSARFAQWALDVRAVASVCANANPRFDSERFLDACRTWVPVVRDGRLVRA